MIYSMKHDELDLWVNKIAKPGDLAYCYDKATEFMYTYYYTRPEPCPFWRLWSDMEDLQKYLNSLEKHDKMNIKCDNCKHWQKGPDFSFCVHDNHKGVVVPAFTSCPDFEAKAVLAPCPFCGGEAEVIIKDWDNRADEYMVHCTKCGVRQKDYYANKESVIKAWNRCTKNA